MTRPGARLCSIPGCAAPHVARGWCKKHYDRWKAHGYPLVEPYRRERPCLDCGKPVQAHMWRGNNGRQYGATPPGGRRVERCMRCENARRHMARRWTAEAIIGAIQEWALLHGDEPPTVRDFHYGERPRWPSIPVVKREFGLWSNAVRAAGFEPRRPGERGPSRTTRSERARHGKNRQMVTAGVMGANKIKRVQAGAGVGAFK